jgi:hypothetical protein
LPPFIEPKQVDKINGFNEKSRRITKEKLATLRNDPFPGTRGDKERLCLKDGYVLYRPQTGRSRNNKFPIGECIYPGT